MRRLRVELTVPSSTVHHAPQSRWWHDDLPSSRPPGRPPFSRLYGCSHAWWSGTKKDLINPKLSTSSNIAKSLEFFFALQFHYPLGLTSQSTSSCRNLLISLFFCDITTLPLLCVQTCNLNKLIHFATLLARFQALPTLDFESDRPPMYVHMHTIPTRK